MEDLPFYDEEGYLRGLSWVDVDGDNDLDLTRSGAVGFPGVNVTGIFLNNGNDQFENTGLISSSQDNPFGHSWADFDNDGDPDLYIGATWNSGGINELWLNENGTSFQQITNSGATPNVAQPYEGSVSWSDYDLDGDVDLYLAKWNNSANVLYINNGDGTFTASNSGNIVTDAAWTSAGLWGDYNNDMLPDLYVVNYQIGSDPAPNILYRNNGRWHFYNDYRCWPCSR